MTAVHWRPGDAIVRREVWHGRPIGAWGGYVVQDTDEEIVLFMPEGAPLAFTKDFFGAPHPWSWRDRWLGHGIVQLHRPGEMHSVWVFWKGPTRELSAWYVNLEEPWRRSPLGFDTQDLELDIVIERGGSWSFKDDELLDQWRERGRWTREEVAEIRAEGARLGAELDAGRRWWREDWASWEPDPGWTVPVLPEDWDTLRAEAAHA